MRTAFVNLFKDKDMLRVFDSSRVERICALSENNGIVITPEEFEQNRDYLKRAEVIFSTWGMPALSQEQLREYFPALKAVFYAAGSVKHFARELFRSGRFPWRNGLFRRSCWRAKAFSTI